MRAKVEIFFNATQEETSPGIYSPKIESKKFKADIIQYYKSDEPYDKINEDYKLRNRFSIVYGDSKILSRIPEMTYLLFANVKYSITNVEINVKSRRIIVSTGGIYNER